MGERRKEALRVDFDGRIKLQFHGASVSSDGELFPFRDLDEVCGLTESSAAVAKVEWHAGELFPRVGFIVTNMNNSARRVVRFYNQRVTSKQWIKEGKNAVKCGNRPTNGTPRCSGVRGSAGWS